MSKTAQRCAAITSGAIFGTFALLIGIFSSEEYSLEIAASIILGSAIVVGMLIGLRKENPKGLIFVGYNAIGIAGAILPFSFYVGVLTGLVFWLFFALGFGMGTIFKIIFSFQAQEQEGG